MATAQRTTSSKTPAALTRAITSGKPFRRTELAERFDVRPERISDIVSDLKREGWHVEMTRSAFQGPVSFVVTRAKQTRPEQAARQATGETTTQPSAPAPSATPAPQRQRRSRKPAGKREGPTRLPSLGEVFEVVLLARNPDGSTNIGLRSPTSGEIHATWPAAPETSP